MSPNSKAAFPGHILRKIVSRHQQRVGHAVYGRPAYRYNVLLECGHHTFYPYSRGELTRLHCRDCWYALQHLICPVTHPYPRMWEELNDFGRADLADRSRRRLSEEVL